MHLFCQHNMSLLDKKDADFRKCCGKTVPKFMPLHRENPQKCSTFKVDFSVLQLCDNVMVTISAGSRPGSKMDGCELFNEFSQSCPLISPKNPLLDEKDAVLRKRLRMLESEKILSFWSERLPASSHSRWLEAVFR